MRAEQRTTPYYKTKLKGLYQTAMSDAEAEDSKLREALDKIYKIKAIRNEQRIQARYMDNWVEGEGPRKIMRRGVLMNLLQQAAATLPLFIPKLGERPPPLCGAISAENSYIAKMGDLVAARVKERDGDENWILAEVLNFQSSTNKYEIMDIDEEGKERHQLSKRKVVPLPLMRANPETDPDAVFIKGDVVMALYPRQHVSTEVSWKSLQVV
ncbi:putative SAGA-associated factor 29-like isoform X1 [Apostichopus japonicus]|uniref:Putative SAGA-associated factor 29-like isoform X1 n=1 Tax=Stichopus japonicus TaxID=307972 RepID=A0A2G8JRE5_STIJA|nr:putative SAGA-associated factor 29-like isoform X1 [Apostichopus japonicus]